MPNVDHFRLDSDYPMDKIVYFKQGTFTPSNGSFQFTHGLSFTPLLFGVISKNSDFSEAYSFNTPMVEKHTFEYPFSISSITLFSNNTNVYFWIGDNAQAELTGTWYYRVYGFSDESLSVVANETSTSGGNLILNSDYNYYRLYETGTLDWNGSQSRTVNHNLGYRPFVLTWGRVKYATQNFPADITQTYYTYNTGDSNSHGIYVDTTKITFDCMSNQLFPTTYYDKIWYRIYANEA